jgi:ATP-dependent DNA ligase
MNTHKPVLADLQGVNLGQPAESQGRGDRKTQPYAKKIAHRGVWVEPSLLYEVEYRAKSAEGKVRHPFFRGQREDL